MTERERQEIPNKIVKPLGLWKDIERKRAALEAKRREFGLVSDQIWGREAPLAPQVPRKRTGDRRIVSDGPVLDKVEELVGRVNNLDIMNNIIKDTEQEEKVVRGALKKTAEFLAGRQVALLPV